MITGKTTDKKSKQILNTGNHCEVQTTSVISNPNINNTETSEGIPPTEATQKRPASSSTLIQGIDMPLQLPAKTFRSNSRSQIGLFLHYKPA